MKKILYTIILFCGILSNVYANCDVSTNCGGNVKPGVNVDSKQEVDSTSQSTNMGQGNGNQINYYSNGEQKYSGSYTIKNAPSISAPSLTTTLSETCMGSSTGGITVISLGLTGGTTWKDEECIRRLNARELANTLGERDAAKELLCGNPEINAVYQSLGRPCLMKPSTSTYIPGGALKNYRDPVEPKIPASHYVKEQKPVEQVLPTNKLTVINKSSGDEQDIDDTNVNEVLKKAELAREEMREKGF